MMFFKKKAIEQDSKEIDIQWGGYYVSYEDDHYSVFQLLDFNQEAYHSQLFKEKFDHTPTLEEIKTLTPYIMHVPIATSALLQSELTLVGSDPLTQKDLAGYSTYLQAMNMEPDQIAVLIDQLITFSKQPPFKVKLIKNGEQVNIEALSDK